MQRLELEPADLPPAIAPMKVLTLYVQCGYDWSRLELDERYENLTPQPSCGSRG